jgi:protein-disulfide isomerase
VFRNFPLSSHQYAEKAAECANDQGKFWEYHDTLYSNQSALDMWSLKTYASQLGLDTAAFNQCLDSSKHAQDVQKDVQDMNSYAQALGLTAYGVPTFFINGVYVSGAQPFSVFQQAIDAALR